jgi:hypothetical protein
MNFTAKIMSKRSLSSTNNLRREFCGGRSTQETKSNELQLFLKVACPPVPLRNTAWFGKFYGSFVFEGT